jgi:thioredoxin reductase
VVLAKRVNDLWQIHARRLGEVVIYQAKDLVLATGSYSIPKKLGITGEQLSHVSFRMPIKLNPVRVLIVGSGFSAADCVLKALESGCEVHHLFRNQGEKVFINRQLNETFPKHEQLKALMRGEKKDPKYNPYLDGELKKIDQNGCFINDGFVLLEQVIILIGTDPNLSFIECKDIQLRTNKYTYQVEEALFAVGPLTGDNFVKLNMAGCFACADTLLKKYHPI